MTTLALHEKHTVSQSPDAAAPSNDPRETDCFTNDIKDQIASKARGWRKIIRHGGTLCCRCHTNPPISAKSRYCLDCRRLYNEAWRARHKAAQAQVDEAHAKNAAIAAGVAAVLEKNTTLSKGNDHEQHVDAAGQVPAAGPAQGPHT